MKVRKILGGNSITFGRRCDGMRQLILLEVILIIHYNDRQAGVPVGDEWPQMARLFFHRCSALAPLWPLGTLARVGGRGRAQTPARNRGTGDGHDAVDTLKKLGWKSVLWIMIILIFFDYLGTWKYRYVWIFIKVHSHVYCMLIIGLLCLLLAFL